VEKYAHFVAPLVEELEDFVDYIYGHLLELLWFDTKVFGFLFRVDQVEGLLFQFKAEPLKYLV